MSVQNNVCEKWLSELDDVQLQLHVESRKRVDNYQLYPYRYVNVFIYILGMLHISIMQNSFAPQAGELIVVYNVSAFVYNLTSLLHMVLHLPLAFPANYVVDKYSTKVGNTIACVVSMWACWIKCFVNHSFVYAIVGQLLVGCANPFIINAINKVSSNWFDPSSRASVTSVLSFFSMVTGVIGLVIPGIYFRGYTAKEDISINYADGKERMFDLLVFQAVIVTLTSLLNLKFYRDKPLSPPSFSTNIGRQDFYVSLQILVKNRAYVLISVSFALVYGCFIDFAVVLGQLINPYGFNSSHTSILSVCCVSSGVVGSVIMMTLLKRRNQYIVIANYCVVGCILSLIFMIFFLQTESFKLIIITAVSLGFFVIPVIPILLELAVEVCFPIGEATVTGFIYAISHIVSFVLGVLFSLIIDSAAIHHNQKQGSIHVLITFIFIFILSYISLSYIKQDLKRTQAEQSQIIN